MFDVIIVVLEDGIAISGDHTIVQSWLSGILQTFIMYSYMSKLIMFLFLMMEDRKGYTKEINGLQ